MYVLELWEWRGRVVCGVGALEEERTCGVRVGALEEERTCGVRCWSSGRGEDAWCAVLELWEWRDALWIVRVGGGPQTAPINTARSSPTDRCQNGPRTRRYNDKVRLP